MQAIPYILMIGSAALQADQQVRAGEITAAQSQIDANAEGDAATEKEIDRKKKLQIALSSQLAQAGAAGVKFSEGSPKAIAELDIAEANRDADLDIANTRSRQRALRLFGDNAQTSGNAAAAATLLDAGYRATEI